MYSKRRQRGLTIVELVMFIVIVGVAAAGILQVMDLTNRNSTDPIRRKQAMLIAEAYMEEVQQAQFTACDAGDQNAGTAIYITAPPLNPAHPELYCAGAAENFGPEANNVRPYDNVNDYASANYNQGDSVRPFVNAAGVDTDVTGAQLGAGLGNVQLNDYTTTLALRNVALNGIAAADVLEITITVSYGVGESVVLQGYRTRYEPRAL
jgi:MSHA pilin protein MshD